MKEKKVTSKVNKVSTKIGTQAAELALKITELNVNSACWFLSYQDELPKDAKKLRKF